LLQAGNDPVDVRYLGATKPEDVGRAGHLLFHGSPVLLSSADCVIPGHIHGREPENAEL